MLASSRPANTHHLKQRAASTSFFCLSRLYEAGVYFNLFTIIFLFFMYSILAARGSDYLPLRVGRLANLDRSSCATRFSSRMCSTLRESRARFSSWARQTAPGVRSIGTEPCQRLYMNAALSIVEAVMWIHRRLMLTLHTARQRRRIQGIPLRVDNFFSAKRLHDLREHSAPPPLSSSMLLREKNRYTPSTVVVATGAKESEEDLMNINGPTKKRRYYYYRRYSDLHVDKYTLPCLLYCCLQTKLNFRRQ